MNVPLDNFRNSNRNHVNAMLVRTDTPHQNLFVVIAVLGTVNLVNQMDRVLFSLMIEPVKADLSLSDSQMGLLGGFAFAAVYAVLGLVAGRIADSSNRVKLIGAALTLWSAATAACGLAGNFVQMFASRMLVGAGEAGCIPASQSIISDVAPAKRRALLISVFTGIGSVGTLIGLILGGILIEWIGWRMTFIAFGAAGFLPLVILFLTLREVRPAGALAGAAAAGQWRKDVTHMLTRPETQILVIAVPLVFTVAGMATWVPAYFQRTFAITTEEFSRVGGAFLGIGLIVGTFAGGIIANRLIARDMRWEFWWTAAVSTLSVVPLLALLLTSDLAIAYAGLLGTAFLAGTSFGPAMACMHTVTKQSIRGTAVASMLFTTSLLAYGGIPALIGALSDVFAMAGASVTDGTSLKYALLVTAVLPLAAGALFVWASRIAFSGGVPRAAADYPS